MEIPGIEFLTFDWIIRSIRLTTVLQRSIFLGNFIAELYEILSLLGNSIVHGVMEISDFCRHLLSHLLLGRAVAIRFGVVRLVVRAQKRYTLGGWGYAPPENF